MAYTAGRTDVFSSSYEARASGSDPVVTDERSWKFICRALAVAGKK